MIEIFLQTLPFFLLIGFGFGAGKTGFFSPDATAALTKFVFYFALSALLFQFSARLEFSDILDWNFIAAYLTASLAIYLVATIVAFARKLPIEEAAIEAQVAVIGNVGFLGIPMLAILLGDRAVLSVMVILSVDLIVFSSLVVILVHGSRDGRMSFAILKSIGKGLLANPMIVSIVLGLSVSALDISVPKPVGQFLGILGAAATPGALFAIGASLATKSAERVAVAGWLSFCKLILHPAAVAFTALYVFDVDPYAAGVMITASALPVAGNVYILAAHFGIAPTRVSASILISTAISIFTVSAVVAWVTPFMPM
ncbi:AEC family transporter [Marivivens sp. LCG002]|uniref:AEC family transporter n=1 Tax=Marivivens sp. LCG002 TaxID=3051171 RepID=UPI00255484C2|nr:AEC family transporter [Marivivens sp. LCG002]WIV50995.1 AEC family transporter [Marivivens sp. LCG002]